MTSDARQESSVPSRLPSLRSLFHFTLLGAILAVASRQLNVASWNSGGVTILWPPNAFLLGVLLCSPKRHWTSYFGVAAVIDLSINFSIGDTVPISLYATACNMLEALLAALLLYPILAAKPDLTQRKQFVAFLAYGVVLAPAVASMLASLTMEGRLKTPTLHGFLHWFTADALGMATVTPLYLAFRRQERFSNRSRLEIFGLFGLLFTVTVVLFWQNRFPFLFPAMPILLLLGVRLGLAGSALGLLLVSIVGGFLTVAGHGPLNSAVSGPIAQRDLLFQLFIVVSMLLLYILEVLAAESRQWQIHLQTSEKRFRLLAEASSDIILLADLEGKHHYVSPAALNIVGWKPEEILERTFREIAHPEDIPLLEQLFLACREGVPVGSLEYRCRKPDGSYLWLEVNPHLYHDADSGAPAGFVNVARDITRRKAEEEQQQQVFETVEHLASSDPLTGIANRRQFDQMLEREWLRAIREQTSLSLLVLDVDHFKAYNDAYGHLSGDEGLRQIVATIQPLLTRPADLLARYGGEEFVVLLPRTEAAGARQMAEWIRAAVEGRGLPHAGNSPYGILTLCVGCATLVPVPQSDHLQLFQVADQALYRAKSSGRNCVRSNEVYAESESVVLRG